MSPGLGDDTRFLADSLGVRNMGDPRGDMPKHRFWRSSRVRYTDSNMFPWLVLELPDIPEMCSKEVFGSFSEKGCLI